MFRYFGLRIATAVGCVLLAATTVAQDTQPEPSTRDLKPPTSGELAEMVGEALPKALGDDNKKLLSDLSTPTIGPSVYENADPDQSARALLGRGASKGRDCFFVRNDLGQLNLDDCVWRRGSESGERSYKEFRFDRNKVLGDMAYNTRPAAEQVTPGDLVPIKMDDSAAANMAAEFGKERFGLPIQQEALGDPSLWQVESLAIGFVEEQGDRVAAAALEPKSVIVEKLVRAPRILDAGVGFPVPVLGSAFQASATDGGIVRAYLRDWTPFVLHPDVDPESALSRGALIQRIGDQLSQSGLAKRPDKMSSAIAYVKARDLQLGCPEPDEDGKPAPGEDKALNAVVAATNGVLPPELEPHTYVPAIVLFVSMGPEDPSEEEQAKLVSSTSFMEQYPLVSSVDKECGEAQEPK